MARKDYGSKPWLFPQPVLIIGTYDKDFKPNAMNAAWGGMYDYDKIVIALSKHKTTENLKIHKAFTVAFGTKSTVKESDYVGIVSQDKVKDKIEIAKLESHKSDKVNAPIFDKYPLVIECTVDSFDEDEGVLIGKIINVSVDEAYIDKKTGKVDTKALEIIVFDPINRKYRLVSDEVGDAFKIGSTLKK